MADDQQLSDYADIFVEVSKSGDWSQTESAIYDFYTYFRSLWGAYSYDLSCDASAVSAVEGLFTNLDNYAAQPTWHDEVVQKKDDNLIVIEQYGQQMVKGWEGEKYYEAGNLFGLIDTYLFPF